MLLKGILGGGYASLYCDAVALILVLALTLAPLIHVLVEIDLQYVCLADVHIFFHLVFDNLKSTITFIEI